MRYEIGTRPRPSSRDDAEGVVIWPYIAAGIVALNVIGWIVVVTVARKQPEPRVVVAQAPAAQRPVAQQPLVIYQQAPQPRSPLPQPSAWAQNPVQQAPAPLQYQQRPSMQTPQPQQPVQYPTQWQQPEPAHQQASAGLQNAQAPDDPQPSRATVNAVADYNQLLRRVVDVNNQERRIFQLWLKRPEQMDATFARYTSMKSQLLREAVGTYTRLQIDSEVLTFYRLGDRVIDVVEVPRGIPEAEHLRVLERKP